MKHCAKFIDVHVTRNKCLYVNYCKHKKKKNSAKIMIIFD